MASTTEYEIYNSDKSKTYIVGENTTNNETSVTMVGHGLPSYGDEQNTNFLHLLENFASSKEPGEDTDNQTAPVTGQLWFKKSEDGNKYDLYVCKNPTGATIEKRWDKLSHVSTEPIPPTNPSTGDIWYDPEDHKFKVYDEVLKGGSWNVIGPTDVTHNQRLFDSMILDRKMSNTITYEGYPTDLFPIDINESTIEGVESNGSLHLVTLKIIAKEFINKSPSESVNIRSCGWVYKLLIRTKWTSNFISESGEIIKIYNVDIVGEPDYELIGKTDETDWDILVNIESNQLKIRFTDNGSKTYDSGYISIGIDTDIVRV